MFDGKVGKKDISFASRTHASKGKSVKDFVDDTRRQRELRAVERTRNLSAQIIQKHWRSYSCTHKLRNLLGFEFDKQLAQILQLKQALRAKGIMFNVPSSQVLSMLHRLKFVCPSFDERYVLRLNECVIESIAASMTYNILTLAKSASFTTSYGPDSRLTRLLATLVEINCKGLCNYAKSKQIIEFLEKLCDAKIWNVYNDQFHNMLLYFSVKPVARTLRVLLQNISSNAQTNKDPMVENIIKVLSKILQTALDELLIKNALKQEIKLKEAMIKTIVRELFTLSSIKTNPHLTSVLQQLSHPSVFHSVLSSIQQLCVDCSFSERLNIVGNISDIYVSVHSNSSNQPAQLDVEDVSKWLDFMSTFLSNSSYYTSDVVSSAKANETNIANTQSIPIIYIMNELNHGARQMMSNSGNNSKSNASQKTSSNSNNNTNSDSNSLLTNKYMETFNSFNIYKFAQQKKLLEPDEITDEQVYTVKEMEEITKEYYLASGIRKLELRVLSIQKSLLKNEMSLWVNMSNNKNKKIQLQSNIDFHSFESIVQCLKDSSFIHSWISLLSPMNVEFDENAMIVDGVNNSAIVKPFQTQFSIIETYTNVLISCNLNSATSSDNDHNNGSSANSINDKHSYSSLAYRSIVTALSNEQRLCDYLFKLIITRFSNIIPIITSSESVTVKHHKVINDYALKYQCSVDQLLNHVWSLLYLFSAVYSVQLQSLDDEELFVLNKSFTTGELQQIVMLLKSILHLNYWVDPINDTLASSTNIKIQANSKSLLQHQCQLAVTRLFNQLCIRNERRAFLEEAHYQFPILSPSDLMISESSIDSSNNNNAMQVDGSSGVDTVGLMVKNPRVMSILTYIPQVIPFKQRVEIFHSLLHLDKAHYYSDSHYGMMAPAFAEFLNANGNIQLTVRRDHIVQDSFEILKNVDNKLKGKIQVEFISEQGVPEAGIDGGGLFKEFIDTLAKSAFNPSFGMFVETMNNLLTPNPDSFSVLGIEHLEYFKFIGKVLGKAIYERTLLESEFANGFLNVLLGRVNQLDDLYHLDREIYNSIMNLKHQVNNGVNIENYGIYFETSKIVNGKVISEELIPNGSNILVTNQNIHTYIKRLSNYKQNIQIQEQCKALLQGFHIMIPLEWLRMFNTKELQKLISGDQRAIDITDFKRNVHYASGYHESQPYIQGFWKVIEEMTPEDQGYLLKFVTSCSRQPLLGFGVLNPKFCIQKIPGGSVYNHEYSGVPRLPSAATCMNLLKLPQYDSIEILREKLLYAIRSNSGFELS